MEKIVFVPTCHIAMQKKGIEYKGYICPDPCGYESIPMDQRKTNIVIKIATYILLGGFGFYFWFTRKSGLFF